MSRKRKRPSDHLLAGLDQSIFPTDILNLIEEYSVDSLPLLIEELNKEVNSRRAKIVWFVCHDCNLLIFNEKAEFLRTSKWGYERAFCSSCVTMCACGDTYCEDMSYLHEECMGPQEGEEEEEDEEEDEEENEEEDQEELS